MKHSNISIFVPHIGCPNMCSFCNQHTISGAQKAPTAQETREICKKALTEVKAPENTEIAFFGGSFTAIPRGYMTELLEAAQDYIGEGKFKGIRISTRPDCINEEILALLKNYGVTAIELGAQSMIDEVLEANDRGHTAADVYKASELIKAYNFELGLQMMVGLYKSTIANEIKSFSEIAALRPDTIRIYPVVILEGTRLAELYKSGEFVPFDFDEVVALCASFLRQADSLHINVIKCGLHASEFVEKDMLGGFYHPAFKELCETVLYRTQMQLSISEARKCRKTEEKGLLRKKEAYEFAVSPCCISKALGHKKVNIEFFRRKGISITVSGDETVPKYQCLLRR